MDPQPIQLRQNHQMVLDRFITSCENDERVVAAFIGGSYARGQADAYSDLDLYLITTDGKYEAFLAGREAFVQRLGKPLFLEDFGEPYSLFYIFANGTEGELWIGRESQFNHIHSGPYRVLLDKKGVLTKVVFAGHESDQAGQIESLRQQIHWFWHELSHFISAMGRGQLWWAYGQLEAMRLLCLNLARLRENFADALVGDEPYFKVEQALSGEQLASLQATYCPMERTAMYQAILITLSFYREMAQPLAKTHGLTYPAELDRLMVQRLEALSHTGYDERTQAVAR